MIRCYNWVSIAGYYSIIFNYEQIFPFQQSFLLITQNFNSILKTNFHGLYNFIRLLHTFRVKAKASTPMEISTYFHLENYFICLRINFYNMSSICTIA